MTENDKIPPAERQAIGRAALMSAVRIGSLAFLLLGLTIARRVIEGPYWLGVVLAVGGMLMFFFGPYFMAKNWKSQNSSEGADQSE